MQFHQNGFHPGDPAIHDPSRRTPLPPRKRALPPTADVVIVGCGPAGLMLAAQLAQFPDLSVVIVEQKDDRLLVGQADGIACRTMELFQALGFADAVKAEAYWVNETAFWKPCPKDPTSISRASKIDDVEPDLSEMPHVIINQARVQDHLLDRMVHGASPIEPDYSRAFVGVERVDTDDDFPLTVTVERLDSQHLGLQESVCARYLVGCDGARSAVRGALGLALKGDSINQAWGVMDVLARTDFPDIRLKSVIQSAHEGSMLVIPREGGFMVRLYIELDKLKPNQRVDRDGIDLDYLVAAANRILQPYRIAVDEVPWWSVYEIGQRLTETFDDATSGRDPRCFLAGDACHTHSPKAGQGLNTSVNDAWNLGWKLAQVLTGQGRPGLLQSYSMERQQVAQQLIDFDRTFSSMMSRRPRSPEHPDGVDPSELQAYFMRFGRFTAGTAIRYPRSEWVDHDQHQALAAGLVVGMRFHSAPVIRHADAKPMQLGHCMRADGRWRVFAFAGEAEPMSSGCGIAELARRWTAVDSPLAELTGADSLLDLRAVFGCYHRDLSATLLPDALRPAVGRYGLTDYEKVFCSDLSGDRDIYTLRGIDRAQGALVVVRPDHFVAAVLPLADWDGLCRRLLQWIQPL